MKTLFIIDVTAAGRLVVGEGLTIGIHEPSQLHDRLVREQVNLVNLVEEGPYECGKYNKDTYNSIQFRPPDGGPQ